jgi:hypothetical protein
MRKTLMAGTTLSYSIGMWDQGVVRVRLTGSYRRVSMPEHAANVVRRGPCVEYHVKLPSQRFDLNPQLPTSICGEEMCMFAARHVLATRGQGPLVTVPEKPEKPEREAVKVSVMEGSPFAFNVSGWGWLLPGEAATGPNLDERAHRRE